MTTATASSKESKKTEILLEQNETLEVIRNGIKFVFDKEGQLHIYGDPRISKHPRIANLLSKKEQDILDGYLQLNNDPQIKRRIGEKQHSGLLFAGISPDTKKPFYTKPQDEPLHVSWKRAHDHAQQEPALRLPTPAELYVMYAHKSKLGHFNESSLYPDSWYWTSADGKDKEHARILRFGDGYQGELSKEDLAAYRLICD